MGASCLFTALICIFLVTYTTAYVAVAQAPSIAPSATQPGATLEPHTCHSTLRFRNGSVATAWYRIVPVYRNLGEGRSELMENYGVRRVISVSPPQIIKKLPSLSQKTVFVSTVFRNHTFFLNYEK